MTNPRLIGGRLGLLVLMGSLATVDCRKQGAGPALFGLARECGGMSAVPSIAPTEDDEFPALEVFV